MQPASTEVKSITFYTLDCLPTWKVTEQGHLQRLPPGLNVITVNAAPEIHDDLMAAADAWTKALAVERVDLQFVEGVCGSLQGAACLIANEANVPGDPDRCAGTRTTTDPITGYINSNPTIFIPDWYDDIPERRRGLLAHELGHLLGLDNSSVAQGIQSCGRQQHKG